VNIDSKRAVVRFIVNDWYYFFSSSFHETTPIIYLHLALEMLSVNVVNGFNLMNGPSQFQSGAGHSLQ